MRLQQDISGRQLGNSQSPISSFWLDEKHSAMMMQEVEEQRNRKSLRPIELPMRASSPELSGGLARFRTRRWYRFLSVIVLLSILALCIPDSRRYILRSTGQLLVVQEPSVRWADIIVVAIDADGAGALAAADLMHRGVSNRVAVFNDPPSSVDREFLRRGLPYEDRAAISTRQLQSLEIQKVEQIPRSTSGSEQEGDILPNWCDKHDYHSVMLVTSADHSRRLTRILRRSLQGRQLSVTVYSSPYSEFSPDTWWKTRAGIRTGIIELEKLLLDFVRHPFS